MLSLCGATSQTLCGADWETQLNDWSMGGKQRHTLKQHKSGIEKQWDLITAEVRVPHHNSSVSEDLWWCTLPYTVPRVRPALHDRMQESYTGGVAKTVVGSKAYCSPTQSRGPLKGPRALPSKGAVGHATPQWGSVSVYKVSTLKTCKALFAGACCSRASGNFTAAGLALKLNNTASCQRFMSLTVRPPHGDSSF